MLELKEEIDDAITNLLLETRLGTNGAIYQHLNTKERIEMLEDPLFLTLKWKDKALGNITFCKRSKNFYLRFFAFDKRFQSTNATFKENKSENIFKGQINAQIASWFSSSVCENMYAYIDPKNEKSIAVAHQFQFKKIGSLNTHIFTRLHPKISSFVSEISFTQMLEKTDVFIMDKFFFTPKDYASFKYFAFEKEGELKGVMRVLLVDWIIHRLPGKNGKQMTKILPMIPFIHKIINPKHQKFIAIDHVWIDKEQHEVFEAMVSHVLKIEERNVAFWWLDENHPLSLSFVKQIKWGLFSKIFGQNKVNIMNRGALCEENGNSPFYVCAYDLV